MQELGACGWLFERGVHVGVGAQGGDGVELEVWLGQEARHGRCEHGAQVRALAHAARQVDEHALEGRVQGRGPVAECGDARGVRVDRRLHEFEQEVLFARLLGVGEHGEHGLLELAALVLGHVGRVREHEQAREVRRLRLQDVEERLVRLEAALRVGREHMRGEGVVRLGEDVGAGMGGAGAGGCVCMCVDSAYADLYMGLPLPTVDGLRRRARAILVRGPRLVLDVRTDHHAPVKLAARNRLQRRGALRLGGELHIHTADAHALLAERRVRVVVRAPLPRARRVALQRRGRPPVLVRRRAPLEGQVARALRPFPRWESRPSMSASV